MNNKKAILIIMDGWGLGKVASADAIQHAKTPFVSSLYKKYPNTILTTCGEVVGLPEGQMGNSEVGHLNLGAGRIVYQELQRINVAVRDGSKRVARGLKRLVEGGDRVSASTDQSPRGAEGCTENSTAKPVETLGRFPVTSPPTGSV